MSNDDRGAQGPEDWKQTGYLYCLEKGLQPTHWNLTQQTEQARRDYYGKHRRTLSLSAPNVVKEIEKGGAVAI